MKKLFPLLFAFAGALSAANTAIVDTIRYSNNSLATCTFSIYGPISTAGVGIATTAGDGSSVTPSTYTYNVVAGVLSVSLHPNDDLTPAGTTYRVTRACRPPGPASVTEYWSVPTSGSPLTVAGVSVSTGASPTMAYGQIRGLTLGDLLYGASTGLAARLPKPSDGTYNLTFTSGIPSWAATSSGLPSMTGNSGKTLTNDGSSASWALPASLLTSTDIIGLFTSCTGTKVLSADGACHATTGGVWGSITGTLGDQTDLNSALAGKAASGASTTVNGQACTLGSTCTVADSTKVPTTRAVNSHALSADVTVSKGDVGLGNADNTSDANKPVSTAAQTALDLKANLASPTFTGTPALPSGTTATTQSQADASTKLATTAYVDTGLSGKASTALNSGKVSKLRKSDDSGDALTCDASGTCSIGATVLKPSGPGVFNVRLQYSGVPDGSTSNNTPISNAFAATNAYVSGVPTIYFDCPQSTTTCQYNYSGSGISPINPLRATTILCAPGATLNYTGSAHAADFGPTNLTQGDEEVYTVQGCRWTGGASMTAGLYWNNYVLNPHIIGNHFYNFGNQTGYTIVFPANNWMPIVSLNRWTDTDGFSKNMVDAHAGVNVGIDFSLNKSECLTSIGGACSVSTVGVGLWLYTGRVTNSEIKFHAPLIRISSCTVCGGGQSLFISHNLLEGNTNQTGPAITFGDPGTTGAHVGASTPAITENYFYWPGASGVPNIGPETASSGSFALDNLSLVGNNMTFTPTGGAVWVNTNQGTLAYIANNRSGNLVINQSTSPPIIDSGFATQHSVFGLQSFPAALTLASTIPKFDANGVNLIGGTAAADVVSLFSGCSGTLSLGADGACHAAAITKIASGTATMGTGAISNNACASVVSVSATGVATTDSINWTPNADISAVTGYGIVSTDGLKIYPYPTADHVNFKVCNGTGSSITPGAGIVLNWEVIR